jgi:hypothetical protein
MKGFCGKKFQDYVLGIFQMEDSFEMICIIGGL